MPIIKTLSKATKAERDKFRIPRSVQDAIPIRRIWSDGIFQVGTQFSKTFSFTDINYQIAGKEDKTAMFLDYSELLNALDSGASAKITINNRRLNKAEFEAALLLPMRQDGLDHFRKEYNDMLLSKVTGTSNSVVQERYITISVVKKNIAEARAYFSRVGTDLLTHLAQLSSIGQELDLVTRLRIFRDFFKGAEPPAFEFDLKTQMKQGHSFKDWLCPDSMEFQPDHFKLNDRWGRVLYLQGYASYIKDSMVSELCELDRDLMLSIDILPVPTDEAVREVQNKLLGVETNAANWQRRQNAANNFTAMLPYDIEQQRAETKEMLGDLTNRDQRMMFGLVTMVHLADTKEQLDSDTESLLTVARKHLCQMSILRWQQKDGLDTVLPYGLRRITALRTLTTESTAVFIPFRAQEIMQDGGIYYGQNAVSKNMIVADRRKLLNGNSFRLGVSGSGKSSLVNEIIYKHLVAKLNRARIKPGAFDTFEGTEYLDKVIAIDQSPIGRTPRSNPATYTGVFNDIRDLFAATPDAKMKGYKSNRFSFNVKGGRCEACQGDGIVKIEMHFLADVYVPCEVCGGHKYNHETLEVKFKGKNIYEVLEMTVDEGMEFFKQQPKIYRKLKTISDVGLGYIKIGQPATTLSGGEAQRVKLATELMKRSTGKTIYILDEPTTGLHTADVHKLVNVLNALVDGGNTVLVIEHNLDVIKTADHIIDLGPEGGKGGGIVIAKGTPEEICKSKKSYTAKYLKPLLDK